eukprot:gene4291-3064_t
MAAEQANLVAFGSCNRQRLPQSFWKQIGSLHPDLFLWMGDAVYTKGYSFPALPTAFQQLLSDGNYTSFAAQTTIDGVWDDHDYGVNDGGVHVVDKAQRAQEYMRFLQQSNPPSPSSTADVDAATAQDFSWMDTTGEHGLYHSRTVQMGPASVKFLFLDTRSFRDDHFVPSLGQVKFPLSAIIASAFRGAYSVLGFGRQYAGDVLGTTQWAWLENELAQSTADVHFVVSSIQVLTSNPVVESWGHFPIAKRKLMDLLAKYDPPQLHFLSGDVHLAEVSQATVHRTDGSVSRWQEITSSGMTHTCQDNPINKVLCPAMLYLFHQHRSTVDAFYTHRNFGTIEYVPAGGPAAAAAAAAARHPSQPTLKVNVRSLEPAHMLQTQPLTSVTIPLPSSSSATATTAAAASRAAIARVQYADFYVIPWYLVLLVVLNVLLFARYLFVVRPQRLRRAPHAVNTATTPATPTTPTTPTTGAAIKED